MSRKTKISLFMILNFATIVWANFPQTLVGLSSQAFTRLGQPPNGGVCIECGRQLLGRYGHLTGFGAVWKLFVSLPRYDYWITIEYVYEDGDVVERPRPYRKHDWGAVVFNHRDNKIDLNLLAFPQTRTGFCRWLCREERARGRRVESVQVIQNRVDIPPFDRKDEPVSLEEPERQRFEVISCGTEPLEVAS